MEARNMLQAETPAFGDLLGEPRKLKTLTPEERAVRLAYFSRRVDAALRRGTARDLIRSGAARYARITGEAEARRIQLVMHDKAADTTLLQLGDDDGNTLGLFVDLDRIEDAFLHAREAQIAVEFTHRGDAL